ncbi:uncharacterized protein CLUP02_01294 [Colletotrichum lupini]|uniref:Uncharacterized protein n=1 Tax=Colletotrichum lupini TaxID=145971 RepID=A0A9Q8SCP3_9PEZI|nr:uncharacterized protein CLUP02_01294 [Colletotrichum lupini]UQC74643.1 hypothetical protein CLUP02_01294 [Colletotrichum lupini]
MVIGKEEQNKKDINSHSTPQIPGPISEIPPATASVGTKWIPLRLLRFSDEGASTTTIERKGRGSTRKALPADTSRTMPISIDTNQDTRHFFSPLIPGFSPSRRHLQNFWRPNILLIFISVSEQRHQAELAVAKPLTTSQPQPQPRNDEASETVSSRAPLRSYRTPGNRKEQQGKAGSDIAKTLRTSPEPTSRPFFSPFLSTFHNAVLFEILLVFLDSSEPWTRDRATTAVLLMAVPRKRDAHGIALWRCAGGGSQPGASYLGKRPVEIVLRTPQPGRRAFASVQAVHSAQLHMQVGHGYYIQGSHKTVFDLGSAGHGLGGHSSSVSSPSFQSLYAFLSRGSPFDLYQTLWTWFTGPLIPSFYFISQAPTNTNITMPSEQKPLSWWKRHCTPPPAINRTPQCPCSACWNGNGEHWKTTVPQTTAPNYTSIPSQAAAKETRTMALRRESESDLTPLRREETSSTTNLSVYSQDSNASSDRASVTDVHRLALGKEIV